MYFISNYFGLFIVNRVFGSPLFSVPYEVSCTPDEKASLNQTHRLVTRTTCRFINPLSWRSSGKAIIFQAKAAKITAH